MTSWDDLDLGDEEAVMEWCSTQCVRLEGYAGRWCTPEHLASEITLAYRRGQESNAVKEVGKVLAGLASEALAQGIADRLRDGVDFDSLLQPDFGERREGWWPEEPGFYVVEWSEGYDGHKPWAHSAVECFEDDVLMGAEREVFLCIDGGYLEQVDVSSALRAIWTRPLELPAPPG